MGVKIYSLKKMQELDEKYCDIDTQGFYDSVKWYRTMAGTIMRQMNNVVSIMTDANGRAEGFPKNRHARNAEGLVREAMREWVKMKRPFVVKDQGDS